MLYPRESESREVKDLSGIWRFKVDAGEEGRTGNWQEQPLDNPMPMPVPASYNDIVQDPAIRDHVGDVWYETDFFVPGGWRNQRVALRFGSVTHHCKVWLNGREVMSHKGGFLPFEADVTGQLDFGAGNRLTLVVNNELDWSCLPGGEITPAPAEGKRKQTIHFDFFNYAGIHRPVRLVATPKTHISDIWTDVDIENGKGVVEYAVKVDGKHDSIAVELLDREGVKVAEAAEAEGKLTIDQPVLWQPGRPYLYGLQATVMSASGKDVYRLPVGIRTVRVTDKEFLINDKPFYFRGFGKHEDYNVRGRGLDNAMLVKDFNLLAWIGANSFRASHYPYAEEVLNLADELGMVVIDESPAVGFWVKQGEAFKGDEDQARRLEHHIDVMRRLIARDRHHPCVVMWSVANEPASWEDESVDYFKTVFDETRKLDARRPVTIVVHATPRRCKVSDLADVVCFNRYPSWYSNPGDLSVVAAKLESECRRWHERTGKPVMVTEYGADTLAGFHHDPPVMFSEEYQVRFLEEAHKAYDRLDYVIGEHVWNFADFATKQGTTRVGGNKKGVFTRDRQPKAAAHLLRHRWLGSRDG